MLNKINFANMVLDGVSRSISINPQRCTRIKHKSSSCTACQLNCPVNAIEVGGPGATIVVDWDKCTGCGICVNVCPTQVYTLRNAGYKSFIDNCCRNIKADGSLEISCQERDVVRGSATASIECIGILNTVDFLALYLRGARKISIKYGDCADCYSKVGDKILAKNIMKLQELSGIFEDLNDLSVENDQHGTTIIIFSKQMPIKRPAEEEKPNPVVDRRGLFKFFTNNIKDTALKSASLMTVEKLEPRTIISFEKFLTQRRQIFLDSIMELGRLTRNEAATGELFNSIKISNLCVYCGMCVRFCGPKALTMNEKKTEIRFNASLCVSCKLCEKACYNRRLSYNDSVCLKDLFSDVLLVKKT